MTDKNFKLKLKGKTCLLVDWANVHGWEKSLNKKIGFKAIFDYFKKYKEVKELRFYFGIDDNQKSTIFLKNVEKYGYKLITKKVKYLKIKNGGVEIKKRKCDFDLEIGLDCFERLNKYDSFIFLSGDGDFITLYNRLIENKKQVIVVYESGHLGREIWEMKKGIFKTELSKLIKKMSP